MVRPEFDAWSVGHAGANTVNLNPSDGQDAGARTPPQWIAIVVGIVVGVVFFTVAEPFMSPPDCASYWAWGESLLKDCDLTFSNQYARLEMPKYYLYGTATGRLANDWPAGSGLALIPAIGFGRIAAQTWVCVLALAALCAAISRVARCTRGKLLAGCCTLFGTPLFFYLAFGPFFSHAVSFAIVTCFLVVWARTLDARSRDMWLLLGVLLGLAALVRPQNGAIALAFAAELPSLRQRRPSGRDITTFVIGVLVGFAPAMIGYSAIYGAPLVLPKSEEMLWLRPAFSKVLFSDFHGVMPWTPLYAIGIAGLFVLARKQPRLGCGLLIVFLAQLYLNSANQVWWGGGSFGNRRLTDVAVVVSFGIGALWEGSVGRKRAALIAVCAACTAWTCLLILAERRLLVPLDRYVPFDAAFRDALVKTVSTPTDTVTALVRPLLGSTGSLTEMLTRVICATFLGIAAWHMTRKTIRFQTDNAPPSRLLARGAAAGAGALSLWMAIAAVRTPPMPPDVIAPLGTRPLILWDNYIELAYYHILRGEPKLAQVASMKALDLRPSTQTALWYLARSSYDAGDRELARDAARRVLKINPTHAGAIDLLRAIEPAS